MNSRTPVDFIGIGAPKCGSTWLFNALGQHPGICLSEPKEVNYFNSVDFSKELGADVTRNENSTNAIEWYSRHFRHCGPSSVSGEFSPTYYCDRDALKRIHRLLPKAKLIACLRNPVDCIYAIYWARRRYRRVEKHRTFEEAVEADDRYLNYGYFAKHMTRVLDYFDQRQLKIVFFDDIVERPELTVRSVFDHLGLDPDPPINLDAIPKNRARESRFVSLEPMMKRFAAFLIEHDQAVLLRRIRNLGVKQAAMRIGTVKSSYPVMSAETRRNLIDVYADDISELGRLTGRDLDGWKRK